MGFCRLAIAAVALVFSSTNLTSGAERVTSERLLPKRTVAFAKIPNATEFRRRWDASSFGAIQRDPAFAPFFGDLERQVNDRTARLKQATGVGLKEVWMSLRGEVGVALVHSPQNGFAVVGIAEIGADDLSAVVGLTAVETALVAHGGTAVRLKAGGVDVTSWSIGSDADKLTFSYFRRGHHLVAGLDLNTTLTLASESARTEHETLADNPVYQYIAEQTQASSGEPALRWFVDPVGGLEAAIDSNLRDNPNRQLVVGLFQKAGVDKFKGIGGSIELASAFGDSVSRTFGYVEQPISGLLAAFQLPATHQVPPAWVSDDTNFYLQVNWSGRRFYQAVSDFFDSFQGAGAFRSFLGESRLPNSQMTVEEGLNQMVGPLHFVGNAPASAGELWKQPMIAAVGIADPKKAGEMLRSIAESAGAQRQVVNGVPTYTVRLGLPGSGPSIDVAASVAEGSLMLSTSPRYLQTVLSSRGKKHPLAQSRQYKLATGEFPEKTSLLGYQRQDRRFEGLYEQIRGGRLQLPLYGGIVTGLGLDFSKLPPGSAIRKYFQTSSSFVEPADKGFRMIEIGYPPVDPQGRPRKYE
jgi:hypothetical protein